MADLSLADRLDKHRLAWLRKDGLLADTCEEAAAELRSLQAENEYLAAYKRQAAISVKGLHKEVTGLRERLAATEAVAKEVVWALEDHGQEWDWPKVQRALVAFRRVLVSLNEPSDDG